MLIFSKSTSGLGFSGDKVAKVVLLDTVPDFGLASFWIKVDSGYNTATAYDIFGIKIVYF